MEIGLTTFGDIAVGGSAGEKLRHVIDEIVLAEQVGLDVFAVGEHHRPDYAISTPPIILAAGAARTSRIKLASSVTVLGSEDPVRVFQQFTSIDLLSGGRAEIWAGRGSFTESFPLFGFDLNDYDQIFSERLDLLLNIRSSDRVTWAGKTRAPLHDAGIFPRPERELPVWIAVGGTPQSVVRAATLGLPLVLAIIGGEPKRFLPFFDLYRQTGTTAGTSENLKTGLNLHGFVADSNEKARDILWPHYSAVMTRIGRERGWSGMTREQYDWACGPEGNLLVGSADYVAEKISGICTLFKPDRFLVQMTVGTLAQADIMTSIELFGTRVAPLLRTAV